MHLAQDNDVVHTLTPDRSDQPFGKAVLPWRGWRGRLVPDAHGAQSACDDVAIDPIPIADEVARSFIPRKGLRYWTFVAALMSVAAVGMSKNRLSRDFQCRPIFDFCNTIGRYRKLVILTNDLAEVPSLDGTASLHFVE